MFISRFQKNNLQSIMVWDHYGNNNPTDFYETSINQRVTYIIVNLEKMILAILVDKEYRLYACRSVPYFFLEQRYHFRSHFVLMNNSVTIRTDR